MALLIDSNIVIYSYLDGFEYLRELIVNELSYISEISRVEILGYHGLKTDEELYYNDIFSFVPIILPSQEIFDKAILLRKSYKLKLGDSLIAATGLVHGLTVYTRNLSDFERVDGLKLINPIR